ncbi:MAG TPA: ribonuclease E inhibitor RraB [Thermoanaerobaculia bacterium]|nr:ribonuclease E inhibitor RraB [Thermoanaerobaculia bacterium]
MARQSETIPMMIEQLRTIGITEDRELKLEYLFNTNARKKAAALAAELTLLGYQVAHKMSSNKKQYVVTGWTAAMPMRVEVVSSWTRKMCELGYSHDCEFDGWGTTPTQ